MSNIAALGSADGTTSALISGNIDALVGSVEGGYGLEQQGRAHVLFAFGDFVKPFITHAVLATNMLQTTESGAALKRFLAAWYEGIAYSRSHKEETVKTIQPILNMDPAWVAKVYDVEKPMFPTDGHYNPEALKVVAKSLIDTDQMPADTDVSRLITEQYLP